MSQITEEAAHQMGAKGAEPTEAERRLFEAWMRGHCWKVCGEWNGRTYFSEHEKHGGVDPLAMNTRQLWAAFRDRGALGAGDYQAGRESMLAELRAGGVELPKARNQVAVDRRGELARYSPDQLIDYDDRCAAAAVPQWIPVSDRMPEEGTECLVLTKHGVTIDTWREQHEAPLSFSSATIPIGLMWDNYEFEDVSHWMPLPQPPKEAT